MHGSTFETATNDSPTHDSRKKRVSMRPRTQCWKLTRLISVTILAMRLTGCVSYETGSKQTRDGAYRPPIVWGTMKNTKGCVIFREYTKATVGFFVVAATATRHGELEVVETDGYTLSKSVWMEDQDSLNELQRLATQNRIRYVKVAGKYTPDELEAARAICGKDNAAQ